MPRAPKTAASAHWAHPVHSDSYFFPNLYASSTILSFEFSIFFHLVKYIIYDISNW